MLPSAWGQYLNFWQMDYRSGAGAGLLDGRGVRVGLHPRHRAIARLSQARACQRRHRDGDDLGAVAAAAHAERLSDAVRFPGASDPLAALHRQQLLDRAAQRSPGGRGAALDRSALLPCARGEGAGPGLRRGLLRDRRQSADQRAEPCRQFADRAGARCVARETRHAAQSADRRDLAVGARARAGDALRRSTVRRRRSPTT